MLQTVFLNKITLRGIVGRINITSIETTRMANFSLVTDYFYTTKDGSAVMETTWHNVNVIDKLDGFNFADIERSTVVEVTGRMRARRVTQPSGESHVVHDVIATTSDVKVLGKLDQDVTLSVEAVGLVSLDSLQEAYNDAEKVLRKALVDSLASKLKKTGDDRLLFQEPVEILYEDAVHVRRHYGNGLYTDYAVIGIRQDFPEPESVSEDLSVIGWGTDGDVAVFPIGELDVHTIRELDTFIGDLFKGDDIELEGDSLRFKEGSQNRIPDFHPLIIE